MKKYDKSAIRWTFVKGKVSREKNKTEFTLFIDGQVQDCYIYDDGVKLWSTSLFEDRVPEFGKLIITRHTGKLKNQVEARYELTSDNIVNFRGKKVLDASKMPQVVIDVLKKLGTPTDESNKLFLLNQTGTKFMNSLSRVKEGKVVDMHTSTPIEDRYDRETGVSLER